MKQNLPILVDGCHLGRVIIDTDRKQATKAAQAAASHISTPTDTQLCPFSDGSRDARLRGGVGLAYKRKWLPQEWVSEHAATDPHGDFIERAWPYSHAKNNMVMEVVGIVEALYAAHGAIQEHLQVLKKHAGTVTVKATTDCIPLLEHIARHTPPGGKVGKAIPVQIMRKIKDLIQALSSLKIKVYVELHWCPRNMTQQMIISDRLAGEARKSGLAYCNATQNFWARATESNAMKELLLVLAHVVRFRQITGQRDNSSTTLERTTAAQNTTEAKRESRRTKHTAAREHIQRQADHSPFHEAKPSTMGNAHSPKRPDKIEAGKRKAEEGTKEGKGEPMKKVKLSRAAERKRQTEVVDTMPAAWREAPTRIDVKDARGVIREIFFHPAPYIRMVLASTEETGERNVFINDGVSPFSLVNKEGVFLAW